MARKPRVFSDKGIYHVIMRGNNKQNLFHDDTDREFFLKRLQKYTKELNIDVYAYCLMSNHVHLLIGNVQGANLSLLIQKIANSYVYFFNSKYERTGHLFQGRFKSEPILDDEYFKTVFRYVVQNCEKAGLGDCAQYKWNSYRFIGEKSDCNILNVKYIFDLFGEKRQLFDFLSQKSNEMCMEYENRLLFTDDKAFAFIKKILGIQSLYELERLDISKQIEKCSVLKGKGLSVSQISRITGISKSIIKSA